MPSMIVAKLRTAAGHTYVRLIGREPYQDGRHPHAVAIQYTAHIITFFTMQVHAVGAPIPLAGTCTS